MRHPVDRYVDRLLRRRRPKPFAPTADELAVLRTAIDLMAAAPDAAAPRPAFVEQLRGRLSEQEHADQGAEAPRPAWRLSPRRRFLAAGALTAAGAAAGAAGTVGVVADRLWASGSASGEAAPQTAISPTYGVWRTVVSGAELPEGAVLAFDLGAVTGFLRRVSGRVQAVSGICTHQGCRLDLTDARDTLSCPCHGATFTLAGANLTHPLQTGQPLPALPRLPVREVSGQIQIYAPRSA